MAVKRNEECSTVCPVCGVRLAYDDEGVCFCPAEYCGYKCDGCKKGDRIQQMPKN